MITKVDRVRSGWTDEQLVTLILFRGTVTTQELASMVGRSVSSVRGKLNQLNGARMHNRSKTLWSDAETRFLTTMKSVQNQAFIAERLGRTPEAVARKLRRSRS